MNQEQIFNMVKSILVEEFEIDESDISLETNIYQDLDIDSIDAVDLMVKLRAQTGRSIEPDNFKQVRTIQDLVTTLEQTLNH
ncbi:acyl carrier protein [Catenovulum sp. 2E275]|uniref:acyl carrier protein n=1 Tax=Catenovulum sp. 2E275 TaxID=2980497 RepID=UPI0021D13F2F|nr:acyl carrier protein [Catenovulum sp. 2E275]MCU4676661.1 acyl carrier protein [Catenovulum sp. 2E275]